MSSGSLQIPSQPPEIFQYFTLVINFKLLYSYCFFYFTFEVEAELFTQKNNNDDDKDDDK